jgi:hypothetical protein
MFDLYLELESPTQEGFLDRLNAAFKCDFQAAKKSKELELE